MGVNRVGYFVLRERGTKLLFPHRKCATHTEFGDKGPPRLFMSRNAASNSLNCWRMGHWHNKVDAYGEGEGPMPSEWKGNAEVSERRKAMDIEIVPMRLVSA